MADEKLPESGPKHHGLTWRVADAEALLEHLRKTWGENRKCPFCDNDEWAFNNRALFLTSPTALALVFRNAPFQYIPIVLVSCRKCGFAAPINLMEAGIPLSDVPDAELKKGGEHA